MLFLDEFLEFPKKIIEMMRQPLEDREITISRLHGSYTFPCNFMLVAAMNPCPCGYFPDTTKCNCSKIQIERYLYKMSKPMMDRMDMNVSVKKIQYDELYMDKIEENSDAIKKRIVEATSIQRDRLKEYGLCFNSQIPNSILEQMCGLTEREKRIRKEAFERYGLSARGAAKILKVARTIADLDGSEWVKEEHYTEALVYRMPDFYKGGAV